MLTDEFFLPTKLYHKNLTELCKPMAQYLGITKAMYGHVEQQGGIFAICSDKPWIEQFLENEYYQLDPVMVHPNNIHNGFAFVITSKSQEFKDEQLYDITINFNWHHGFVYVEKLADGSFFWYGFATDKENYQLTNRLVNEAPRVKRVIKNIHKKLTTTIQETHKMDFASLKGKGLFDTQKGLTFNETKEEQRKIEALLRKNLSL